MTSYDPELTSISHFEIHRQMCLVMVYVQNRSVIFQRANGKKYNEFTCLKIHALITVLEIQFV